MNRNSFRLCLAVLLGMLCTEALALTTDPPPPRAYIPEPVIRSIMKATGKSPEKMTDKFLRSLTCLNLYKCELDNLDFLGHFPALKQLGLGRAEVKDYSALNRMKFLEELDLYRSNFSDVKILKNLKSLKKLSLSRLDISDLRPMNRVCLVELYDECKNWLTAFELKNNPLFNMPGFMDWCCSAEWELCFPKLEYFDFSYTNVSNLSHVACFVSLLHLDAEKSKVIDTHPLKNLKKLEYLRLSQTDIENVEGIEDLLTLRELYLDSTFIWELKPLANHRDLEVLDLTLANYFRDLRQIAHLTKLKKLFLRPYNFYYDGDYNFFSPWTDFSVLRNLTELVELDFSAADYRYTEENRYSKKNPKYQEWEKSFFKSGTFLKTPNDHRKFVNVVDISVISNFKKLERLYICNQSVKSFQPLKELKNLKVLWLCRTVNEKYTIDLSFLLGMENLTELYLEDISSIIFRKDKFRVDYSVFSNLKNLEIYYGNMNSEVTDLRGLGDCGSLKYCFLSMNGKLYPNIPSSLSAFSNLKKLTFMIIDVSGVCQEDKEGAPYVDISSFSGLSKLKGLYLSSTCLLSLEPLTRLKQLDSLCVETVCVYNPERNAHNDTFDKKHFKYLAKHLQITDLFLLRKGINILSLDTLTGYDHRYIYDKTRDAKRYGRYFPGRVYFEKNIPKAIRKGEFPFGTIDPKRFSSILIKGGKFKTYKEERDYFFNNSFKLIRNKKRNINPTQDDE